MSVGHIFGHLTCTRVSLEGDVEEHGWVDHRRSACELYDNRNDVSPVVDCPEEDDERLAEEVSDALGWLEGGYEEGVGGTFYASESYEPYASDLDDRGAWSYSYALHFTRKSHSAEKGWHEEAWSPPVGVRTSRV